MKSMCLKNNYHKPPCLRKILLQSWSPWLLSDRSSHLLCWRKRKQIWEIKVNSFPPAQEAIDEAAKVGWVESILRRKSGYYGIGNTLRHHILHFEWKINIFLYICETGNHKKDCPPQHCVWVRWIWFHLWYDGEADGDAGDHVGDEPLHGVLGQPCQDRDSAFHLFKDKDRFYPSCQYLFVSPHQLSNSPCHSHWWVRVWRERVRDTENRTWVYHLW